MNKRKLILNAACVLAVFAGLAYFARPKRPAGVQPPSAAQAQAPAAQSPAQAPAEPLPVEWNCPADPGKWFKAGGSEVIDTEKRWNKYLEVSGFEPPEPVDLSLYRVALFTFRAGGVPGFPRFEASRADGRYTLTLITAPPADEPAAGDRSYDCRIFLVPAGAGELSLDFRTGAVPAATARSLVMPLPYDASEVTGALPDDGDRPIALDKPVAVPGSGEPSAKKISRPAAAPPPPP